ncbi:MAG: hypothetical protein IPM22_08625 [Betaproteobacteria bacterium]|nr:hypothetical protein [Betaproteobacteria bacterium]MCC7215747.1 hypothetical protein [Burkholderiales bacterium]
MLIAALHFLAGTLGSLLIFVIGVRISGAKGFSAPFGVVFVGVACAALAHFVSQWATPAILLLYAISVFGEAIRDRST